VASVWPHTRSTPVAALHLAGLVGIALASVLGALALPAVRHTAMVR
jgi:hypothetical protein